MAEKMRYENEIENAKVDDEFNNSEEDLSGRWASSTGQVCLGSFSTS